jgi:AbiTii
MTGLVEQIQQDAINPQIPVTTLLRKVKVAAVKLGLDNALSWVQDELEGYKGKNLPKYRISKGVTNTWNPYHGWQYLHVENPEIADLIATINLYEPIGSYEKLLDDSDSQFRIDIPNELLNLINQNLSFETARITNSFSRGVVVAVVNRVRDMVLDWSLELTRAGITGEGMSFSQDERDRATNAHITIGNFNGSFNTGDAVGQNSKINQSTTDNSSNSISGNTIFSEVEKAVIAQVSEPKVQEAILSANTEMKQAGDKGSFVKAYSKFMSAAADHMQIISPFIPELSKLLTL